MLGGLNAEIEWDWLHIRQLWVDEGQRRRGLGSALMQYVEKEAAARGCRHAYVDRFTFQAPGFYEKLGYRTYAKADDWPVGHAHHFLTKDLPPAP